MDHVHHGYDFERTSLHPENSLSQRYSCTTIQLSVPGFVLLYFKSSFSPYITKFFVIWTNNRVEVKVDGPGWKWTVQLGESGRSKRPKVDGLGWKWTVQMDRKWTVYESGRSKESKVDGPKNRKWTVQNDWKWTVRNDWKWTVRNNLMI